MMKEVTTKCEKCGHEQMSEPLLNAARELMAAERRVREAQDAASAVSSDATRLSAAAIAADADQASIRVLCKQQHSRIGDLTNRVRDTERQLAEALTENRMLDALLAKARAETEVEVDLA